MHSLCYTPTNFLFLFSLPQKLFICLLLDFCMEDNVIRKLEDIMRCPICNSDLKYERNEEGKFKCIKCGKEYKIKDGIILMLD